MIAVAPATTRVSASGMGLETARAGTASRARRGVEGMKAATMKTASGTKASATAETTTAATVETAAPAAATMARLGYVREREPRHDSNKR